MIAICDFLRTTSSTTFSAFFNLIVMLSKPPQIHTTCQPTSLCHRYDNNTIGENGLETRQFISLLSDNPHLANYTRSLEVEFTDDPVHLGDIASVLRMCLLLNKITRSTARRLPFGTS